MQGLIAEFRRRSVFRVAAGYAVVAWLLAQAAGVLESSLGLPDWFDTLVVSLLLLGFPVALILAWAFEVTPDGVHRAAPGEGPPPSRNRIVDFALLGALGVVGVLIVGDRLLPSAGAPSDAPRASADAPVAINSLAVLPFADFSAAQDQAYLGDGIAEELLNVLARTTGLRVASRTSAFTFRERQASAGEIAEALGVEHVLEGSVRKQGDQIRITAQLIDARTDEHLWSNTYDREMTAENVFAVQDEIARAIVQELQGRTDLLPDEEIPTASTAAYEAYLRGNEIIVARTPETIRSAITAYIEAVAADPTYADAWLGLSIAYGRAASYTTLGHEDMIARSLALLDRAEAFDPSNPAVHAARGWATVEIAGAKAAFEKALALDPNDVDALRGLGRLQAQIGYPESGLAMIDRAIERDPLNPIIHVNRGAPLDELGRRGEAIASMRRALELEPDMQPARSSLGVFLLNEGRVEEAHRIARSFEGAEAGFLRAEIYRNVGAWEALEIIEGPDLADTYRRAASGDRAVPTEKLFPFSSAVAAAYREIVETAEGEVPPMSQILIGPVAQWLAGEVGEDDQALAAIADDRLAAALAAEATPPGAASVVAVAGWHQARGRTDEAFSVLEAFAASGRPYAILAGDPVLGDLRDDPRYAPIAARIAENTEAHRAVIEAQLADPPEVWWTPGETETTP